MSAFGVLNRPRKIATAAKELLEWARSSASAALTQTTTAHRDGGYSAGEIPNASEWNYHFRRVFEWVLHRADAIGLFAERQSVQITVSGTVDAGDTRRFVVSENGGAGISVDYMTTGSEPGGNAGIAEAWAAAINADANAKLVCRAFYYPGDTSFEVYGLKPGIPYSFNSFVTVDVGTLDAGTTPNTLCDTRLIRPADDDPWDELGFLVGSDTTEDRASGTTGDERAFFLPQTGVFRAGRAKAAQWDAANRGLCSAAFGEDCTADGDRSFAVGDTCSALGAASSAFGQDTVASGYCSFVAGFGAKALGDASAAFGTGEANGAGAFVAGNGGPNADGDGSVSMGNATVTGPSAEGAVCLGGGTIGGVVNAPGGVGLGEDPYVDVAASRGVAIGKQTSVWAADGVALGRESFVDTLASRALALMGALVKTTRSIGLGAGAKADTGSDGSVLIGTDSAGLVVSTAQRAIGIGKSIVMASDDTIAVGSNIQTTQPGAIAIGRGGVGNPLVSNGQGSFATGDVGGSGFTVDEIRATATLARVHGRGVEADAEFADARGHMAHAHTRGMFARSGAPYSGSTSLASVRGEGQAADLEAKVVTSNATQGFVNPAGLNAATRTFTIPAGKLIGFDAIVIGSKTGRTKVARYNLRCLASQGGGAVTLHSSMVTPEFETDATWDCQIVTVGTDGVGIRVQGAAGDGDIRWEATIRWAELSPP